MGKVERSLLGFAGVLIASLMPAAQGCLQGEGGLLDAGAADGSVIGRPPSVTIGLADAALDFTALEDGGTIPLETFGQGGTHASMAVRCVGLGNEVFIDITLENLETGESVMTVPSSRPQLLACEEDACDLAPIYVMTGGLADPGEKDGLRVRVVADARNPDGLEASASVEAVLRGL